MGTSLPYARAACKVLKEKKSDHIAIILTGDGGFNFQLNDLIEFMKEELNVIFVYMRNNIYGLGKNSDAKIYHCNSESFDAIKLIEAYGGTGKRCETVEEFTRFFTKSTQENKGIKFIEVPSRDEEKYNSFEVKLLNLYIKTQNNVEGAQKEWDEMLSI